MCGLPCHRFRCEFANADVAETCSDALKAKCKSGRAFAILGILANGAALALVFLKPGSKFVGALVSAASVSTLHGLKIEDAPTLVQTLRRVPNPFM